MVLGCLKEGKVDMLSLILGAVIAVTSVVSVILRKKNSQAADTIDGIIAILKRLADALGTTATLVSNGSGSNIVASIRSTIARLEKNPHDVQALADAHSLISRYEGIL